jgi:protein SCO1/2
MEKTRLRKSQFALSAMMLLVAICAGCSRPRKYQLQGEVVAKNVLTSEITVKHGDIPGFMSAMVMPYRVKDPAVVQEVQAGDKIAADVMIGKDPSDYWLEDIRITDRSARVTGQPAAAPRMLMPGERVFDAARNTALINTALINQDGRTIHLADFAGKALLVTFIYTRCPMPDFCPRLSAEFARIHKELKKESGDYGKTHLLTISFDPKYDTPAVLRKYGLRYLEGDASGFSHWDFTSTNADDMGRLAQAFGLEYGGKDDQITHSMSIVLIAPDGTVAKYWSTDWTWEEVMKTMQNVAHGSATQ